MSCIISGDEDSTYTVRKRDEPLNWLRLRYSSSSPVRVLRASTEPRNKNKKTHLCEVSDAKAIFNMCGWSLTESPPNSRMRLLLFYLEFRQIAACGYSAFYSYIFLIKALFQSRTVLAVTLGSHLRMCSARVMITHFRMNRKQSRYLHLCSHLYTC